MSSNTSWQNSSQWYDDLVGKEGQYYHRHVILPNALRLLALQKDSSLLDIACGQGILARHIPKEVRYTGFDISPSLIKAAKEHSPHKFLVHDATKPFPFEPKSFSHAACFLAIQNIESPALVFKHTQSHLKPQGKLLLVMNHPSYRIPRQSGWGFDETTKIQFRKVQCYMSAQKIPIQTHPGKGSETTLSFHHPLSDYSKWLFEAGFKIELIEEWCSDKVSTGAAARWENRARKEFPLFLTILATL
jgi:ubiquinone/menaquinone biosynthesis C-methylase UbiE